MHRIRDGQTCSSNEISVMGMEQRGLVIQFQNIKQLSERMNLWKETKSVTITREMEWQAYFKVKKGVKSAGVDLVSMEELEANRSQHQYKLRNRMASGRYFPPPVKESEIPKKDGKDRKIGIPTISDRVGQMVVKEYFEPRFEKIFSPHS